YRWPRGQIPATPREDPGRPGCCCGQRRHEKEEEIAGWVSSARSRCIALRADIFPPMDLRPHIEKFSKRLAEVEGALNEPKVFANNQRFQELSKEYARLKELVAHGSAYLKTWADLDANRELLESEASDSELAQMAKEEI